MVVSHSFSLRQAFLTLPPKEYPEGYQAILQALTAIYGSYKGVSEKEHRVSPRIEGGDNFPDRDGQDRMRTLTVVGDEMTWINPTASIGERSYAVWKRIK